MTHKIAKSDVDKIRDFALRVVAHAKEMRDWRAQMKLVDEHSNDPSIPEIERYVKRPMPREDSLIEAAVNEHDEVAYEVVDDGPSPGHVLAMKKIAMIELITRAEMSEIEKIAPCAKQRLVAFRRNDVAASDAAIIDRAMRSAADEQQKLLDLRHQHEVEIHKSIGALEVERNKLDALNRQRGALAIKMAAEAPGILGKGVQMVVGPTPSAVADAAAMVALSQQVSDQDFVVDQVQESLDDWRGPMAGAAAAALKEAILAQERAAMAAVAACSDHAGLLVKGRSAEDLAFMAGYDADRKAVESIRRWAAQAMHDVSDLPDDAIDSWVMPALPSQS
jgi:hypothetical protein